MVNYIKNQAQNFCLASYKIREFVFCTSPAMIALAAVNKGIKDANAQMGFKYATVQAFLEDVLPEEGLQKYGKNLQERTELWRKVDQIVTKYTEFEESAQKTKKAVQHALRYA